MWFVLYVKNYHVWCKGGWSDAGVQKFLIFILHKTIFSFEFLYNVEDILGLGTSAPTEIHQKNV